MAGGPGRAAGRALWQRLAQRPNAVRFAELARLLKLSGWELDRVEGSHHVFLRGGEVFVLPYRRGHVLPVYVREVLSRTQERGND